MFAYSCFIPCQTNETVFVSITSKIVQEIVLETFYSTCHGIQTNMLILLIL